MKQDQRKYYNYITNITIHHFINASFALQNKNRKSHGTFYLFFHNASFKSYKHKLTGLLCAPPLTLNMTSAQVVETSVTYNTSFQYFPHPDDHTTDTPGFKPFTMLRSLGRQSERLANN